MIIATAGHVDHGKTALVNALTGVDTDRLIDEKRRGLTIDLGFAYTDTGSGARLGFVDVPGHIRFIGNMLAGVPVIDRALLVVAADDGVMPQTVEHLDILDLLGITGGVIALTKIDRCDARRIENTTRQIKDLIEGSFLAGAGIHPVSSTTGEGLEALQTALELAAGKIRQRKSSGLFRLAIDRRFIIRGAGIVVTGSVFSGAVVTGDELLLMPRAIPVRVRGLHTRNREAESARAGDRCAVNITGKDLALDHIHRGDWLTANDAAATGRADLLLRVLEREIKPLAHWTPVHIHSAANHVTGHVALLESSRLAPGHRGLAQLVFNPPVNLCVGDRVVIRDQAALRTLGGGPVLEPDPPKRGRAKPARVRALQRMDPNAADAGFRACLLDCTLGAAPAVMARKFNLTRGELSRLLEDVAIGQTAGDWIICTHHLEANTQALQAKIDAWHQSNPGRSGLSRNQLQKLVSTWSNPLVSMVIRRLLDAGELTREGNLFKRPGFGVQLNRAELQAWRSVLPLLQREPTKPPVLHDLARAVSMNPKALERILNQVVRTGRLFRPVKNRYLLTEAIPMLTAAMSKAAGDRGEFTVQQYRDATGIGRNLCIELLEYFDRQGVTRRTGDTRQIMRRE